MMKTTARRAAVPGLIGQTSTVQAWIAALQIPPC